VLRAIRRVDLKPRTVSGPAGVWPLGALLFDHDYKPLTRIQMCVRASYYHMHRTSMADRNPAWRWGCSTMMVWGTAEESLSCTDTSTYYYTWSDIPYIHWKCLRSFKHHLRHQGFDPITPQPIRQQYLLHNP